MVPRTYSLAALLVLATVTVSAAQASVQTQISLTNFWDTEFDLAGSEADRLLRVWSEFSDFNAGDGSFAMQIVQTETGKVVYESTSQVLTSSTSSEIDFNSFVGYVVNEEDICQNENFNPDDPSQNCDPLTGEYEMHVSTMNGAVSESIQFSIVDSRV
jgi:hypothetical protein